MSKFQAIQHQLFFSKNDQNDIRLGDIGSKVDAENLANFKNLLLGYPDDEGIKLNGGRVGAAFGPDKIREFLYKMTPPENFNLISEKVNFLGDYGNLQLSESLAERHETAKSTLETFLKLEKRIVTLGGGHDYAYPDCAAFVKHFKTKKIKPMVINFDAHLDVRPTDKGFNSGTPFYRLLSEFKNDFHFVEIGIQAQCNSQKHLQWLREMGGHLITNKEVIESGLENPLVKLLKQTQMTKSTPVFVSFDIDAITSSEGGGCSQSWITGIQFRHYLEFFKILERELKIQCLGIYEVSPPLDVDNRTSKMAALAVYRFLFGDVL